MSNTFFRYLLWLLFFVLLQELVFEQIPLGTYVCPMVYVLFILMLPVGYSPVSVLLWAFFLGICVDTFSHGIMGTHTISIVAMAYVRPFFLKLVTSKEDRENMTQLQAIHTMGARYFVTYASLAVVLHHTIYFLIDTFSFFNITHTLLLIALSSLLSITLVFILSSLTVPRRKSNTFS